MITFYPIESSSQSDTTANPCNDKLFVHLQKKNLDSMTTREYDYYIQKSKECGEYAKYLKKMDTQKEIETSPGNAPMIVGICLGGLAIIGLIGAISSNNK